MRYWLAIAVAALGWTGTAQAQALSCSAPAYAPRPHPELPSANEPARQLPIGGYTLALTWSPQSCFGHQHDPDRRFQCGSGNRFGFTLHGLWPDGVGPTWPQYCAATPLLSRQTIARNLCSTPSAQLLQHEWAKHGTCMPGTPEQYFARSTGLYGRLRFPDMDRLSRGNITAGQLRSAVAAVNPGLSASAIRVTVNRNGWLDELWLCLDRSFAYTTCRANSGGVPDATGVRVWRVR